MKERTYHLKIKVVKVVKGPDATYNVVAEGAGYVGQAGASNLGLAFERAYQSVIDQASEEMLKIDG